MSDDLIGQEQAEEQTAEAMPTSEEPAEQAQVDGSLPDQATERTKAEFEKLKQHNLELSRKLAVAEGRIPSASSVLDEVRPSAVSAHTDQIAGNIQPAPTVTQTQTGLVDDGGFVDPSLLNAELLESRRQAEEARRIALETQQTIQRFQESEQVRHVHAQFPQLDPNNIEQFDRTFYDLVKNELHGQFAQGKRDLLAAATKVSQLYSTLKPTQSNAAQAAAEEAKVKQSKTISNRERASTQTSTSRGTSVPANREELVRRSYKGDNDAIFARLQASGN